MMNSNLYTHTNEDENQSKIAQFLTDEKHFDSLTSKRPNTIQKDYDYESMPNSGLLSQARQNDTSERSELTKPMASQIERQINEDLIEARIQQEKEAINEEWEQKMSARDKEHIKVMEALQKANEYYSKRAEEHDDLKRQLDQQQQQIDQQKQFTEQIIDRCEKAVQQSIDAVKKQKELEEERDDQRRQIESMNALNPDNAIRRYAEQHMNNPMDLSMSLVIKDSKSQIMYNQGQGNILQYYFVIYFPYIAQNQGIHGLENIFNKQKAVKQADESDDDYSDEEDENTFKLHEFLIETDDPRDLSKSLIILYMKNKTSKEKNKMIQSMANALSNDSLVSTI